MSTRSKHACIAALFRRRLAGSIRPALLPLSQTALNMPSWDLAIPAIRYGVAKQTTLHVTWAAFAEPRCLKFPGAGLSFQIWIQFCSAGADESRHSLAEPTVS